MLNVIRSNFAIESGPILSTRVFSHTESTFRFIPESYLAAIGPQLDPGLDHLVYLRMLIEEDTEDLVQ